MMQDKKIKKENKGEKKEDVKLDVNKDKGKKKEDIDYKHMYQKALADYQNLLKRTAREKEEYVRYANEQLIYAIIPVYDNLKISLEHTNEQIEKSPWLEGVKFVLKQFGDIFDSIGIEEIKTVGEKFDHNTMEAVEGNGDKVVREAKPGYRLNGKVIIPARVVLENQ